MKKNIFFLLSSILCVHIMNASDTGSVDNYESVATNQLLSELLDNKTVATIAVQIDRTGTLILEDSKAHVEISVNAKRDDTNSNYATLEVTITHDNATYVINNIDIAIGEDFITACPVTGHQIVITILDKDADFAIDQDEQHDDQEEALDKAMRMECELCTACDCD